MSTKKNTRMKIVATPCLAVYLALGFQAPAIGAPAQAKPVALERAVDLEVGEAREVQLSDGKLARVKLLGVEETRDKLRHAVRESLARVEVNGVSLVLTSAMYHLPVTVGGVQIDCPVTSGVITNSYKENAFALAGRARFRLWPAASPWTAPGTFVYPIKEKWFASDTQMGNEPVFANGEDGPGAKNIYYHVGLDFGGVEGMVEVVSATDGLVVSAAAVTLPGYTNYPTREGSNVVCIVDGRDWYLRYSHLKAVDVKAGDRVAMGQHVGWLGKEGGSGGWSHLHFDINSRQPSGAYGIQDAYPYAWEAYQREHSPGIIAVARPHALAAVGDNVRLDGSRSWSAAGKILSYEWTFTDGGTATGSIAEHTYKQPGSYSEILKITDARGAVDYDFAVVQVLDPAEKLGVSPAIHAAYYPTEVKPGTKVTFSVRSFRTKPNGEVWDFGDGTPKVKVTSDGNATPHAPNGYAFTEHAFAKPGHYLVCVEHTNAQGRKGVARLHVAVEP